MRGDEGLKRGSTAAQQLKVGIAAGIAGCASWIPTCLLAVWLWTSYLTSALFHFFRCKMGLIGHPCHTVIVRSKLDYTCEGA